MSDLERALVIGRATYERWLGIDPLEIETATVSLRGLDPSHPLLPELESRVRRAGRVRAMLQSAVDMADGDIGTRTTNLA